MTEVRQEILANIDDVWRQMERLADQVASGKRPLVVFTHPIWQPNVDVYENLEEVVVLVELAGVKPEEVAISVDNSVLTVRGARRDALRGRKQRCYIMEINSGIFERTIPLPAIVDGELAEATYSQGFLEIVLPKAKEPPIRIITIRVQYS
ncbi:MAG: Hsp20/alpha crystallin family protein [Chloroflexi bacterium]|nr:Hsp20/alpha crystallin family protein [Chloroflexota bacterium]